MAVLEELRYTAARRAYQLDRTGSSPENFKTWADWWESKYGNGQTFLEYIAQKQGEK